MRDPLHQNAAISKFLYTIGLVSLGIDLSKGLCYKRKPRYGRKYIILQSWNLKTALCLESPFLLLFSTRTELEGLQMDESPK